MTAWFKRKEKGIQTATEEKKDTPKGLNQHWLSFSCK